MRPLAVWATLAAGLIGFCAPRAAAAPPEHANPALAPWFKSLKRPGSNQACCDLADCRTVRYRIEGDHFQAFIGGDFPRWSNPPYKWLDVPGANVLHRADNPTGEGVACWFEGKVVCFIEGNGT